MKKKISKSRLFVQLLCWVLIAMMIIGAITYSIYAVLSMF